MTTSTILVNHQELLQLPHDLYIPPDALKVFLDTFEGPLDLLLYLIRRQNLDILQIPIAKITDQYINYINAMQVLNIELAAEYLLMAAVLLEIKSRILLPRPAAINDESVEELDPRQELIARLIEYEKIKYASQELSSFPQADRDYLWINVMARENTLTPPSVLPADLQKAWETLLIRSLNPPSAHHIKKQELSVREHMTNILRVLNVNGKTDFFALFELQLGMEHVVVNFIAILELGKEGLICIEQNQNQAIFVSLIKD